LLKQCNILANLQSVPVSGEEGRAWNTTICRIFKAFLEKADSASSNNEKKLTYEYLAIFLIGAIEGFTVIGHDERGPAEEVDLWVANESTSNFWQRIGNPFIVECKNWGKPVGVQEIRNLNTVMDNKNIQFAILLSKNGITGDVGREATSEISNAFKKGRYIMVLDQADLLEIANGVHPEEKIQAKYYALHKRA